MVFADYAVLECVELVSILPPPLPAINQLMHVELCNTFSVSQWLGSCVHHHLSSVCVCVLVQRYGYCRQADCGRSHDVLIVLTMEEHKFKLTKAKRKRKKG